MLYRFSSDGPEVTTSVKSLDFVYLPGDSDIVCINALQDEMTKEYIVGIGFVTDQEKGYLNIYGSSSQERLSECYLRYSELSCVPLQLTHTYYISPTSSQLQWAFLLSRGRPFASSSSTAMNESPICVFARLCDTEAGAANVKEGSSGSSSVSNSHGTHNESVDSVYGELSLTSSFSLFPELACIPRTTILYMDFMLPTSTPSIRLSAFGGQDGWFGAYRTDMKQGVLLQKLEFSHDSAITSVRLFNPCLGLTDDSCSNDTDRWDLLVCSAFEAAVVYSNIFRNDCLGLSNQLVLPHSTEYDHVNCASVGDFDFDGILELVLGTFGQTLLFYRWKPDAGDNAVSESTKGSYELVAQRSVIGPVHCLSPPLDIVGDGLKSLVILTNRGLHVYRHKIDSVLDLLKKRLSHRLTT
ncbi:hypothetical protein CRM22_010955 [Opisthorchis felineus]|uniref:Kaptin n=1 Tax=Opisthorchis felineus TaxID=147828 RepID=A0A4S2KM43_OPIFE|nr:hypothetical protein CRM22_010955 [Opisthorchis felineus]